MKEAASFLAGDLVVCTGVPQLTRGNDRVIYPEPDTLYTVRAYPFPVGIVLQEIVNRPEDFKELGREEPAFYQGFFRSPSAKEIAALPKAKVRIA